MKISTIAFRNLGRHKRRTFLSIFALVIAGILGLFMLSFLEGMKTDLKKNILAHYTGAIQIRHGEYNRYEYLSPLHLYVQDEAALREKLLGLDGVTQAVGRITAGGKIYIDETPEDDVPGEEFSAMALGIDIHAEEAILRPRELLVKGRLPRMGSREVALGYGLAQKIGLEEGDKFAFMTGTAARGVNAMTFEVAGLLNFSIGAMSDGYFLVPFDTMQDFVQMPGGAQEILLMTEDPETAEVQAEAVNTLLASDGALGYLETKLWKHQGFYYGMMGMAFITYNFYGIFFLIMGATVIINTTMMVIFERYREIGILGAMGMKPKELVRLFFLEALFAGMFGAVLVGILGSALILTLEKTGMDFGAALGVMDVEMSRIIYPDLKLKHVLLIAFYTVSISALVTLIPSRKAARIEPDEAIRST